ncbi:uncharacterized protein PHACADRAFT_248186 [Phanerochaete carnosa HHB-10118-sp]|uniref:Uncharacterized protein n=1 Tax=Phanerochaete carnosa (strain HHB-10118-sp) TaxID=650164 RepID=K5WC43_PHACS|nr:uncharacterized protein PHACADRAFT_248186 [Phanerochaete carnosa HHB-10118-sp]EKM61518.1 hypothetical protein PHACADRAFT_248186 [Phanerochaete carnosa HHB-10118-sp]
MASPTQTFEHAGFQPPLKMPVVPNRPGEHGSPSTTGRVLSPLTSSVIFIDDDRSINVAPPSYRGHDSQSSIPPSPGAQTTQTTQTGVSAAFSTRATCGV